MAKKSAMLRMVIIGLMLMGTNIGCNKVKQEAAINLDEARLDMASAKKVEADVYAYETFRIARLALRRAEKSFKNSDYAMAKKEATRASEAAKLAKVEAKEEKMAAKLKKSDKPKKTVKSKRK